jgi:hypothetical protein
MMSSMTLRTPRLHSKQVRQYAMQYTVTISTKITLLLFIDSCAAAALNEELEMEKYVDMVPTALQYCPAYETGSCIKRP